MVGVVRGAGRGRHKAHLWAIADVRPILGRRPQPAESPHGPKRAHKSVADTGKTSPDSP